MSAAESPSLVDRIREAGRAAADGDRIVGWEWLADQVSALDAEVKRLHTERAEVLALLERPQLLCEDDDKPVCGWLGGPRWPDAKCWEHQRQDLIAKLRAR